MFVSKFFRARLIIFTFLMLFLWITYYYTFRNSNITSVKDTTGVIDLVPEMAGHVMNFNLPSLVLVTVFYECLCPDSRSFFVNQLLPVMELIPEYIKIDLIPYGKASTEVLENGVYKFKCQHGPLECLGNKIHACTLINIKDDLTKVKVTTCMINDNYNAQEIGKKCCEEYKINWFKVETCALGTEGELLLKEHGDRTHALSPKISFIPTILLNKERSNQIEILKNFKNEVCTHLKKIPKPPKHCE
ncbi:hypothetical protein O3M35_003841 [Rhynocoris fuscipes]|uniref:Uncharacterized protein n=1 Tax=Rhynocoris fuscipes TaxID=488301 RepID=A0AAW1CGE6_9HEMI